MKKFVAVLTACTLAFACVACSKDKKLEDVIDEKEILDEIDVDSFGGIISDIDVDIDGNTMECIYTISEEYDEIFASMDEDDLDGGSLEASAEQFFEEAEDEGVKGEITIIYTYLFSNGDEIAQFEYSNK